MSNQEQTDLQAHIAYLEQQLKRYQAQEDALIRALSQAQLSAEDITTDAKKQAERLLSDSDMVIKDARHITANARSIMEQAELEGQQRMLAARVEADKLLFDTQMYAERMRKETEDHVRMRLGELQCLVEDSQRTLEASRARMAHIICENMDNIRVFMSKLAQLHNDSQDESLRKSLNEALRQMQDFLHVFRNDNRLIPGQISTDSLIKNAPQYASPQSAARPPQPAREEEEKVWTVEDVMRNVDTSGAGAGAIPQPLGELLSDEALDAMPLLPGITPQPQTQPQAGGNAARLDELVDEGLNHTLVHDRKPAYAPRAPYSVDARLDELIARMMTPEQAKAVAQPRQAKTAPAPQGAYNPGAPNTRSANMPSQAPYSMPQRQTAMPPQSTYGPAQGAYAPGMQQQPYVEGLQLRRGGHSSLSPGMQRQVPQAGFIRSEAGHGIGKQDMETLPDDFEL